MTDQPPTGPRVMVVTDFIPKPDNDGGSLRMANILALLADLGCQVTLVPNRPEQEPASDLATAGHVARLKAAGVRVLTAPQVRSVTEHLQQDGQDYDVVMLSGGVYIANSHFDSVRQHTPQAVIWFDTVDLTYLRLFRQAKVTGNRPTLREALRVKQRELELASRSDRTLVVSDDEARLLQQDAPGARTHVVSNIHQVHDSAAPFEARSGLVFIGAFRHTPNLDALQFFSAQVMPLVRPALPGARLTIIGADPPGEVLALAAPDVIIAGHVPDLGPYYDACRLSVAPLRFGAGVKGKVLLSLGYGVPVVGTSVAAEGSYLEDGVNMRIADTPEGLARAIVEVYTQPALWQRLSENGLATIERRFSWAAARRQLQALLTLSLNPERTPSTI